MRRLSLLGALVVLEVILCRAALGELDWAPVGTLIDKPNPTLVGIEPIRVVVAPTAPDPNVNNPFWVQLDKMVQEKLKGAGIQAKDGKRPAAPELRVDVRTLNPAGSQEYVFYVRTSLASNAHLPGRGNVRIKPDVWHVGGELKSVAADGLNQGIIDSVMEQIETFAVCHKLANPEGAAKPDANSPTAKPKRTEDRDVMKGATAQYKYVASRKSKVFHSGGCRLAERIAPRNLIPFNTREEAVQAGKRPCKRCKP
jgi:hypothetical protein